MYGDPTTTPGGKAIPFHSSIRIKLGAGQQIKEGDDVIGINVSAKTVKNKVAPPFRTVNFQIHFGKGIVEHEEMFDVLRKHGPVTHENLDIALEGTGGWKTLTVADNTTGEVIVEKKFRKNEFNDLLKDREYSNYVNIVLDKAMTKVMNENEFVDIDVESYEEIKSLAEELNLED